jgi:hypothetical protein
MKLTFWTIWGGTSPNLTSSTSKIASLPGVSLRQLLSHVLDAQSLLDKAFAFPPQNFEFLVNYPRFIGGFLSNQSLFIWER